MGQSSAITQKIVVGLLILVIGAAGGYLLYSTKYKPAVAALDSATQAQTAAQSDVAAKQKQLTDLKNQPKASKEPTAKYLTSKTAIPQKQLIIESKFQINEIGKKSGIQLTEIEGKGGGEPAAGATGVQPITFTITGTARYANVLMFMQRLHEEVEPIDGKVYVRGRLFNVMGWEFGTASGGEASGPDMGAAASGTTTGSGTPVVIGSSRPFSITVELYSDGAGDAATGEPAGTEVAPGSAGGAPGATATTPGATATTPGAATPGASTTGTGQPATGTSPGTSTTPGAPATSAGSTPASASGSSSTTTSPTGGQS